MNKSKEYNKKYLTLALDNLNDEKQIIELISKTSQYIGVYKVGFEQFICFGSRLFKNIRSTGNKIFLDLKLHDIPNTVSKAVYAASEHCVDFLTIHTSGGLEMMKSAVEASKKSLNPPKIIGVTILTSIDDYTLKNDMNITSTVADQIIHLTKKAAEANLDGIVCSAADLPVVKQYIPPQFEIVTPGIRLDKGNVHDQKRVATPDTAVKNGATLLVIGRAITESGNPSEAANQILESIG